MDSTEILANVRDMVLTSAAAGAFAIEVAKQWKSNLTEYSKFVLASGEDIRNLLDDPNLRGYFFALVNRAKDEANKQKLQYWAAATVSLATSHKASMFKEDFIHALGSLSVNDLVVLQRIYTLPYDPAGDWSKIYSAEIEDFFRGRGWPTEALTASMRRLITFGYITQGISEYPPWFGFPNNHGRDFLQFLTCLTSKPEDR